MMGANVSRLMLVVLACALFCPLAQAGVSSKLLALSTAGETALVQPTSSTGTVESTPKPLNEGLIVSQAALQLIGAPVALGGCLVASAKSGTDAIAGKIVCGVGLTAHGVGAILSALHLIWLR
jgi:hypothetical protein